MNVQSNIKMSSWLFGGILIAYLLAELTGHILFSWIAMSKLIWLSMKFYWLGIVLITYWHEQEPIPLNEEIALRPETESPRFPLLDRTISHTTQQSNEETSKWN